jgi:hypothetical protein
MNKILLLNGLIILVIVINTRAMNNHNNSYEKEVQRTIQMVSHHAKTYKRSAAELSDAVNKLHDAYKKQTSPILFILQENKDLYGDALRWDQERVKKALGQVWTISSWAADSFYGVSIFAGIGFYATYNFLQQDSLDKAALAALISVLLARQGWKSLVYGNLLSKMEPMLEERSKMNENMLDMLRVSEIPKAVKSRGKNPLSHE